MLYLLDANVLIDANRHYYHIDRVPEFWEWLQHLGHKDLAKVPREFYEEIRGGNDELAAWIRPNEVQEDLLLGEEADATLVSRVVDQGYAPDLRDDEVVAIGRDPFLIAYALASPTNRCVVTSEVSKPRTQRQNRKIPDVCRSLSVRCIHPFEFFRTLDFRTDWDQPRPRG